MGGSVWLGRGTTQLAGRVGDPKVSQSASLLQDISDCLDESGVKLSQIDLLACATGPGSFTGLRIGIATLKALASSLAVSCIGIPTLQAVAHAAGSSAATVALLPAGRGEVFAQLFSVTEKGSVSELDSAAHLSPANLIARYAGMKKLKWAGIGAQLQRNLIESNARELGIPFVADEADASVAVPDGAVWELAAAEPNLAKHVGALALPLFRTGELQSAQSLNAIYVRPSDAELNLKCR